MRLGKIPPSIQKDLSGKKNIWIHAVSVGEVLAVVGLIEKIKERYSDSQIVLSTVTTTGQKIARSRCPDALVIYAPLDFSLIVKKFIRIINPQIYITAETEIWPNLFYALNKAHISIIQINGRISDESFVRYKKIKYFLKGILGCVSGFCMQTPVDAERIIDLGARSENVFVVGNLKYDHIKGGDSYQASDWGYTKEDAIWIAGSTHPGEEEIVLNIFDQIKEEFPHLRLIIVPRHIERTKEVMEVVKERKLVPVLLSGKENNAMNQNDILIVDEIGHLRRLYALSKLVFMGKSMTAHGGQNIIEPAFFGKPIVVGPNMQNFKAAVELLLRNDAIIQIHDAEQLCDTIKLLLHDPVKMQAMGRHAQEAILSQQGSTEKTLNFLSPFLKNQ